MPVDNEMPEWAVESLTEARRFVGSVTDANRGYPARTQLWLLAALDKARVWEDSWRGAVAMCEKIAKRCGFDTTEEPPEGIYTTWTVFAQYADRMEAALDKAQRERDVWKAAAQDSVGIATTFEAFGFTTLPPSTPTTESKA